jgi:hypothetical protein
MTGLFATLVMDTPAPAVRLGVRSHVKVLVVIPSSHEILDTLSLERFSGSVAMPVFSMTALSPTCVIVIPVPADKFCEKSYDKLST